MPDRTDLSKSKESYHREMAKLSFPEKIKILKRLQRLALKVRRNKSVI